MNEYAKASQSEDLMAAAREMDRERDILNSLKGHQQKGEGIAEDDLVVDPDWVYSSKVLYEWNEGKPFEGDDLAAAKYGLGEMASFNYTFFNVDSPWSETDSRGLFDYFMRLDDANDHQKVAFAYLHEMFDIKDPNLGGFVRMAGQMVQDPSNWVGLALPITLITRWGGRQAAKEGAKYKIRQWAKDILSNRMAGVAAVEGAAFMSADDAMRQDVENQYASAVGREEEDFDWLQNAIWATGGAAAGYGLVKGGPAVAKMVSTISDNIGGPGTLNAGVDPTAVAKGVVEGAKEFFGVSSAFTPEPGAVSTRFPTAVKKEEDPFAHNLVIGIDEFKKQPDLFKHNVQMTREYPNIQKSGTRSVDAKSEEFIEHAKSNLLYLHDSVPPAIRDRSKLWYDGANRITKQLASEYQISEDSAAGVMAALSPQKDWFMNASLGQRLIDIAQNHSDIVFDGELYDHAIKIYTQKESTSASQKAKHLKVLNSIKGESFSELSAGKRAYVVRAYDELYNSRDYAIVAPEGEFLGPKLSDSGAPSKVAWGSNSEIGNALKALMADGDLNQISEALGAYHKVRNFYNNIRLPNSPNGYVTVDTHAVAAALLRPLAGHDKEVKHMLGSGMKGERGPKNSAVIGIKGLYALYAEAYRRAASERGLLPREMQSITWEAVRGLYPDTFKSGKTNKAEIDKIWKLYKNKKMTLDEARQAAIEYAGGINLPDWAQ